MIKSEVSLMIDTPIGEYDLVHSLRRKLQFLYSRGLRNFICNKGDAVDSVVRYRVAFVAAVVRYASERLPRCPVTFLAGNLTIAP